jgi:hypothetical protein
MAMTLEEAYEIIRRYRPDNWSNVHPIALPSIGRRMPFPM